MNKFKANPKILESLNPKNPNSDSAKSTPQSIYFVVCSQYREHFISLYR